MFTVFTWTKWKWVMERTELKGEKAFPFSFQTMIMPWWAKFISHFNEYQSQKNEIQLTVPDTKLNKKRTETFGPVFHIYKRQRKLKMRRVNLKRIARSVRVSRCLDKHLLMSSVDGKTDLFSFTNFHSSSNMKTVLIQWLRQHAKNETFEMIVLIQLNLKLLRRKVNSQLKSEAKL